MGYKFEKLEVWELALTYGDSIYQLAEKLPRSEEYNLKSQITRAATSIALNVAEGSTSQSDAEQARFVGMAIRSLIETVACQHLIHRRSYISDVILLRECYRQSETLFAKLQSFRTALNKKSLREESVEYLSLLEDDGSQTVDVRLQMAEDETL